MIDMNVTVFMFITPKIGYIVLAEVLIQRNADNGKNETKAGSGSDESKKAHFIRGRRSVGT
jgi:hypothetical protein